MPLNASANSMLDHQIEVGQTHAIMKTHPPPEPPLCGDFQAEIGITATAALDCKKKELVGDFKAVGRELEPKGSPIAVRTHDFIDKQLGKAIPYGVYDIAGDAGFVNVGIDRTPPSSRSPRSGPGGSNSARALPRRRDADDHGRLRRL